MKMEFISWLLSPVPYLLGYVYGSEAKNKVVEKKSKPNSWVGEMTGI